MDKNLEPYLIITIMYRKYSQYTLDKGKIVPMHM